MYTTSSKFQLSRAVMLLLVMFCSLGAWANSPYNHSGEGTKDSPYLISSVQDWTNFCLLVKAFQVSADYASKYYKLTTDLTVEGSLLSSLSYSAGDKTHPFSGSFDGDGHTLTFNYNTILSYGAPFYAVSGATISNLNVAGRIGVSDGKNYASGIAGYVCGTGKTTITNCTVSSTISSSGNGSGGHGGFAGYVESGAKLDILGCTFSGGFVGYVTMHCGGFVGYNFGDVRIENGLFFPSAHDEDYDKFLYSFCHNGSGTLSMSNVFRAYDGLHSYMNQGLRIYGEAPDTPVTKSFVFGNTTYYAVGNATITGVLDRYGWSGAALDLPQAGVLFDGQALATDCYDIVVRNANGAAVTSLASPGSYTLTATCKNGYYGSISKSFVVANGEGTLDKPYLISSAEDWDNFATDVKNGQDFSGEYFMLTTDLTVSTMVSLGNYKPFKGVFLGGGHTLTLNLSASSNASIAPFFLVEGATIQDLNVKGTVTNSNNGLYNASLVSECRGNTTIRNCHSTATLYITATGIYNNGGLVGLNKGTLTFENCSFKGRLSFTVSSGNGGFLGRNDNSSVTFTDCLFAPVETSEGTGESATFVSTAGTTGNITFTRSYYTAAYSNAQGTHVFATPSQGICQVVSAVDGLIYYGPSRSVSGLDAIYPLGSDPVHPVPVVKDGEKTLEKDVDYALTWDESEAAVGTYTLTVSGMGDYTGVFTCEYRVAVETLNFGGQEFTKGHDAAGDYYVIASASDLRNLSAAITKDNRGSGLRFVQTADIDLADESFKPIGYDYSFQGTYDGGYHTISGLSCSATSACGLFGVIENATVKNIFLISPVITSTNSYAGGIVGYTGYNSASTIENCVVVNPTLSAKQATGTGAIVGYLYGSTCRNCYFIGDVYNAIATKVSATVENVNPAFKVIMPEDAVVQTAYEGAGLDENGFRITSGSAAGYYAKAGATVSFSPRAVGYAFSSASYNDGTEHPIEPVNGKFSFTMPARNVEVTATLIPVERPTIGTCGDTSINGGADVTWSYDTSTKELTISGSGAMMYYGSAEDNNHQWHSTAPWSHFDSEIEKVIVGDGVTYVGSYAFAYCTALISVSLPASVTALGNYVCYSSNVARIDIPSTTAATIGTGGFDACPDGLQIAVPAQLLKTYKEATNWSAYAAKMVGVLNETTGFDNTFAAGKYEYTRNFKCGVAATLCLPFAVSSGQISPYGKVYTFAGVDKTTEPTWTVVMRENEPSNSVTGNLEANTPYLFLPYILDGKSKGDAMTITFNGGVTAAGNAGYASWDETSVGTWTFQGVYYNFTWNAENADLGKVYGFAAQNYDGGSYTVNPGDFVKAAAGASIAPFRAFLKFTPGSSAPNRRAATDEVLPSRLSVRLVNADDIVTAIGIIDTNTGEVRFDSDAWYSTDGRRLNGKPAQKGVYINNGKKIIIK